MIMQKQIFNKQSKSAAARLNLARWYNKVETFGYADSGRSWRPLKATKNHHQLF